MIINKRQSDIIKKIVNKIYSEQLDRKFLTELTPDICRLLDIQYFATVVFNNSRIQENLQISNNPDEFNDVYQSLFEKDFILENMIESNRTVVFRELLDKEVPHSREFIHETQKTRPASDGCYVPIRINNRISGFFGVARAGLNSSRFSKNDVEIFNFAASFLEESFRKTLYPETGSDCIAYLNNYGEVVSCGKKIKQAFCNLFGEKYSENPVKGNSINSRIFSERFNFFKTQISLPGKSEISLEKDEFRYNLRMGIISSPEYRLLLPGEPQYTVSLQEHNEQGLPVLDINMIKQKYSLTNREAEIIEYIYQGLSNRDISQRLKTAESTVKRHVWNIFNKTGAESRTQLIFRLSA